jgi:hypothetical protein
MYGQDDAVENNDFIREVIQFELEVFKQEPEYEMLLAATFYYNEWFLVRWKTKNSQKDTSSITGRYYSLLSQDINFFDRSHSLCR